MLDNREIVKANFKVYEKIEAELLEKSEIVLSTLNTTGKDSSNNFSIKR